MASASVSSGSAASPASTDATSFATSVAATPSTASTSASAQITSSETSIVWGPAVTASPFGTTAATDVPASRISTSTTSSAAVSSPTLTVAESTSSHGLSHRHKQIIIATTVIAGTLFIAIMLCILLRRRRRGASVSRILSLRRSPPSTVDLTPSPQADRLTALPIYHETRYSVHSSIHKSQANVSKLYSSSASVPPEIAQRFHQQNPWVNSLWKTPGPSRGSQHPSPTIERDTETSFLMDASPPRSDSKLQELERARTNDSTRSSATLPARHASRGPPKEMRVLVREPSANSVHNEGDPGSTPVSPGSQQNMPDRWSWTNSNAPPTPRYPPSLRSSISSLPRFRTIKSWVRGQSARVIPEHPPERPATSASTRRPVLKNQASLPSLAPLPPNFTKHGRVGSLSSIFQQHPGNAAPTPGSPGSAREIRPSMAPTIEMRQQRTG